MKIHVHSIVWNAEYLMPYFLRHYTQFAKVFIIDDHSTDKTVLIAKYFPDVKVETYPYKGLHNEDNHSKCLIDSCKRNSKDADWVMCVDQDEFIYHPDMHSILALNAGIMKPRAYMMISKEVPKGKGQIYDEVKTGVRTPKFDKPVIFNPEIKLEFGNGRHTVTSEVEPIETALKLLHYKYLSRDYYHKRAMMDYPKWEGMDKKTINYRINKGLMWFDDHIDNNDVII